MDKCQRGPAIPQSPEWPRWQAGQRPDGIRAATRLPKANSKSARVAGITRTFAVLHVVGARLPNVEIQRNLARQFELHRRITAPQLILRESLPSREAWEPATPPDPRSTRVPQNKRSTVPCPGKSDRANRDRKPTPDTPGSSLSPATMVANACPPSSESAGGSP
jgi:hypothetical protein